jgi:hypothetical protein
MERVNFLAWHAEKNSPTNNGRYWRLYYRRRRAGLTGAADRSSMMTARCSMAFSGSYALALRGLTCLSAFPQPRPVSGGSAAG